jgi:hypothetical protein
VAENRLLRGRLGPVPADRVAVDDFRRLSREHVAALLHAKRDDIARFADQGLAAGRRQDRTDFECVRGARRAGKQRSAHTQPRKRVKSTPRLLPMIRCRTT